MHHVRSRFGEPGEPHRLRSTTFRAGFQNPALDQFPVDQGEAHAFEHFGPPRGGQEVVGDQRINAIAHAVFNCAPETEAVGGSWCVIVGFGGKTVPACEAAFTESLDDLLQSTHDGVTFHVPGATALLEPSIQANLRRCGRGALRPACYTERRREFTCGSGKTEASSGTMRLTAGGSRKGLGDEALHRAPQHGCPAEHFTWLAQR